MINAQITDGRYVARVHPDGHLITGPREYDDSVFHEMDSASTAYNFYGPKARKNFILRVILAYADKQVSSSTNATVVVYEAESPETTTASKTLLQFELGQNQSLPITPLNLKVTAGVYVNAKTDDDDIHMTIMGHYIDQRPST